MTISRVLISNMAIVEIPPKNSLDDANNSSKYNSIKNELDAV